MTSENDRGALPGCTIPLPVDFSVAGFLEFHGRDPQAVAERIDHASLHKGLAWQGRPACLTIRFSDNCAEAELAVDGATPEYSTSVLESTVRRMLGLTQDIEAFEQACREHPQAGRMIRQNPGLRVPLAANPFEALTWAVTGQQISLGAAVSLRRNLILAAGLRHSGGLACYPDALRIYGLRVEALRQAGFSKTKAQTLLTLSQMVVEKQLPLDAWIADMPAEGEVREKLLDIRGIGPWTVNYALLRGFGYLDGSLHGDAGVRRGIQILLGSTAAIGEEEARQWLAPFSPWRALVAAHLWSFKDSWVESTINPNR